MKKSHFNEFQLQNFSQFGNVQNTLPQECNSVFISCETFSGRNQHFFEQHRVLRGRIKNLTEALGRFQPQPAPHAGWFVPEWTSFFVCIFRR